MKAKTRKPGKSVGLLAFLRTLPKYKLPWLVIIAAFVFNVIFNQLMLKMPSTTADLLSGAMTGKALWSAISYYVALGVMGCLQTTVLLMVESYSVYRGRKSLWRKMLRTKVRYYDENDPSQMMSAVTNDVNQAILTLVNLIVFVLPDLSYVVQAVFKISDYHYSLALAELSVLPLKYIYMVVLGRSISNAMNQLYMGIGALTGYLAERISHLPLVKSFTGEKKEMQNGETAAKKLYKAQMKITALDCANVGVPTLITIIEKIIVMVAAVVLLRKGIITIQQWVAFFLFSMTLSSKFDNFIAAWMSLKIAQGTASRSVNLMNAEEEAVGIQGIAELPKDDALSVEFDKVSFSYGEHQALNNVSFTVPAGTSVCIVGLCGSGKTTALNLMERFYEPTAGEIRIGGVPADQTNLEAYRRKFSYVQQGADIFCGTVREAITYGIPREVSDEEILAAAEVTGFGEYIRTQPMGLDTSVGSGGDSMSGGQNQRLVLTREYLRNADIILMDEPTSALDLETSGKIRQIIKDAFRGKTRIVVSHDLDLAKDMDLIVVLDNGECAGVGTAETLSMTCDPFQRILAAHEGKKAAE